MGWGYLANMAFCQQEHKMQTYPSKDGWSEEPKVKFTWHKGITSLINTSNSHFFTPWHFTAVAHELTDFCSASTADFSQPTVMQLIQSSEILTIKLLQTYVDILLSKNIASAQGINYFCTNLHRYGLKWLNYAVFWVWLIQRVSKKNHYLVITKAGSHSVHWNREIYV